MPPELMRFLESMRTRGRAGKSRQMSGMYKELKALEEYEADINRQATTKSKQQSRRKSKGSWGGILGGLAGLAILSAVTTATGGLATVPTLALMGSAGIGAATGTYLGGARGGKLSGGVGDIKGLTVPKGAFKRFEGARVRGKEKLDDINTQLEIGRDTFKSSITSNALNAALSAYLGAGDIRAADAGIRSFGSAVKQYGFPGAIKATSRFGAIEAGRLAEKGAARAASLTPEQIYAQSVELNKVAEVLRTVAPSAITPSVTSSAIAPSAIPAYEPPTFGETGIGRAVTSGGDWLKALLTSMYGEQTNPWQRPNWTP